MTKGIRITEREFLILESKNAHRLVFFHESLIVRPTAYNVFIRREARKG